MLPEEKKHFGLVMGIVRDNDDPQQMGRLKVYIPSLDSKFYKTKDLPWAMYVTPFGGVIKDMKVGREETEVSNITAYGMWSVPKNGAHVLCGFLNGNTQMRFWIGCIYPTDLNRSLPQALNDPDSKELKTEIHEPEDSDEEKSEIKLESTVIDPLMSNLKEAGLGPDDDNFKTRGWERSVAYPSSEKEKPDDDGYAKKPGGGDEKDSQIFSFTTPGRHYITMSDVPDHCRIRIRTTAGQQVILDDTNERIYISTAKGRNWIEIDEDGRIFVYAKDEINIRSEDDINIKSEKNINIKAKQKINLQSEEDELNIQANKHVNIKSTDDKIGMESKTAFNLKIDDGPIKIDSKGDVDLTSNDGKISFFSQKDFNIRSENNIKITANQKLDLRGDITRLSVNKQVFISAPKNIFIDCKLFVGPVPKAEYALRAQKGETVENLNLKMVEPEKESWSRPDSKQSRNKNWKA